MVEILQVDVVVYEVRNSLRFKVIGRYVRNNKLIQA